MQRLITLMGLVFLVIIKFTLGTALTRGIVIDAGSGGSRLHIYQWNKSHTVTRSIIYPTTDEKWTAIIQPGLALFANYADKIDDQLSQLISAAKNTLRHEVHLWSTYPIYLKATGGMRQISQKEREYIMNRVRENLSNRTFCPFAFEPENARVISGEEEAVFSWIASNYLLGALESNIEGYGTASLNTTFGTLDLGGASAQIAFFVPSQDISEGMFRVQLGGQKHWNLYAKSFLQFGHVSARHRHLTDIASRANFDISAAVMPSALSFCLHAGYSEYTSYPFPTDLGSRLGDAAVEVTGPAAPTFDQAQRCRESLLPLMLKDIGSFCRWANAGQCSIGAAYQPALPSSDDTLSNFVGVSSYRYAWEFMRLPQTASIKQFKYKSEYICSLSFADVMFYFSSNGFNNGKDDEIHSYLPYFCFLSSYVIVLLTDGYGFSDDHFLTILDEIKGNKVSWTLGAMIFEINTFPAVVTPPEYLYAGFSFYHIIASTIIGLFLGILFLYIYQMYITPTTPSGTFSYHKIGGDDNSRTLSWNTIHKTNMHYSKYFQSHDKEDEEYEEKN